MIPKVQSEKIIPEALESPVEQEGADAHEMASGIKRWGCSAINEQDN